MGSLARRNNFSRETEVKLKRLRGFNCTRPKQAEREQSKKENIPKLLIVKTLLLGASRNY